jgi:SET domain-containing protein
MTDKGRGVFARRDVAEGEVVERSPVVPLPPEQTAAIEHTLLDEYVFLWGPAKDRCAVALGLGSLFNHSYEPNVAYSRDHEGREMLFTALRDVPAGTELTINYNGVPDCRDPVWFDVA